MTGSFNYNTNVFSIKKGIGEIVYKTLRKVNGSINGKRSI